MKRIAMPFLVALVLGVSACTGSPSSMETQATAAAQTGTGALESATPVLSSSYKDAAPVEMQLLVGIFKLEGTDLAVTSSQAKVLEPLWQQIQSLSQGMSPPQAGAPQSQDQATPTAQAGASDGQAQMDELLKQVQDAMTADQIKAIADMQITRDTAKAVLQQEGMPVGGPGGQPGNGQQPPQGTPPSGGGQAPQGTPIAGGQQPPQGAPQQGEAGQPTFIPPQAIDVLIGLLQNRIVGKASQTSSGASASPKGGGAATGGSNNANSSSAASGAYTLDGGPANQDGKTYTASQTDESAIYVKDAGNLTLTNVNITTTGNSSSNDNSSFYGLNAAVLAAGGSTVKMSDSQVATNGTGANGVFSTGKGTSVTLSDDKISASGDGGHAVMATQGGTLSLTDVDMTTSGGSSSAVATDRGGGTITVTGGTVKTSGQNSAGIYSTGSIEATNTTFIATGAEAAVIEGGNSIALTNVSMTSSKAGKWGVMIYQSMSGDAQGTKGAFTMTGGSLEYTGVDGPLFYVTNSTGIIQLKSVKLSVASGTILKAAAGNWGNTGSNGGTVLLTADDQALLGNVQADKISSVTLTLEKGSTLEGAVNADDTAKAANLALDVTSSWIVTADSHLAGLSDASGISGATMTNIIGNGHTVYYDASLAVNSLLAGKTYSLSGGGTLEPGN
jgi:hypothetical protein